MKKTQIIPRIHVEPSDSSDHGDEPHKAKHPPISELLPDESSPARSIESKYTIIRKIGDGGMGIVRLAKDNQLGRHVAIKHLNKTSLAQKSMKARFFQEAKSVAALAHPYIVHIYALDEDEDGPCIVMEYVSGPASRSSGVTPPAPFSLIDLVNQDGPLSIDDTLNMMLKISSAMEYAHRSGIIHRDLKPSNVLLDESKEPKIVDFGLARSMSGEEQKLTGPGERMLSLGYGAPEQEVDANLTDERSDIYGLGALTYFCLTGQNPRYFRESDVPSELRTIIVKALQTDKEKRWASTAVFMQALEDVKTPSITDPPTIKTIWRCKWCDTVNPVSVQFCTECGWDGVSPCIECGSRMHVGIQFCNECGANAREYERATKLLKQLQRHMAMKDYSYVSKRGERSTQFRAVGINGRKVVEETLGLRQQAETSIDRAKTLKELIRTEMNSQNYERVSSSIVEYEDLTDDHLYDQEKNALADLMLKRNIKFAQRAMNSGDWKRAERIYYQGLEGNEDANDLVSFLLRRIRLHRTAMKTRRILSNVAMLVLLYIFSAAPIYKILTNRENMVYRAFYRPEDSIHKATFLNIPLTLYAHLWGVGDMYTERRRAPLTDIEAPNVVTTKTELTKRLGEMRLAYKRDMLKTEVDYGQKTAAWPDDYMNALNQLRERMQREGDFAGWEAVTSESDYFAETGEMISDPTEDLPEELATLRLKFRWMLTENAVNKNTKTVTINEKHIDALKKIQKDLTKKGHMSDAIAVEDEIERVESNPDLATARVELARLEAIPKPPELQPKPNKPQG
jgi:serine/threonine protein kinase